MNLSLDPQQKAAVLSDSRQVLCLAGAGSGKTRILVERIAHLVQNCKVSPYEIAAYSFTRKASGELRQRIEERIGKAAHHITMGTIHAIALRFLKRFGELVGLRGKSLTVYGEFEENFLLKECAVDLGIYKKAWNPPKREIEAMFARYYQEGLEPVADMPGPAEKLFHEFIGRCKENNSITYGGLLVGFKILLPLIKQYLHFTHIFVDEVQDLDPIQHALFKEMAEICEASLFYVGDLSQSIYSFRGAVPEYLMAHQSEFEIYPISTNYRSCPEIVSASNNLIRNNSMKIPLEMVANRADTGSLAIIKEMDSEAVCDYLLALHALGEYKDSEIAILGRVHYLLKKIASKLEEVNLPFTYIGRETELIESPLFRTFHAFLKLLVNPFCNMSFLLCRDLLGLTRKDYNQIRLNATQESKSHFQAWQSETLGDAEMKVWFELAGSEWNFQQTIGAMMAFPFPASEAIVIKEFIEGWMIDNPNGTLADYLDWLATWTMEDEVKDEDPKLKLMTIHQAKGLEFPLVILIGCNEGILPSKQSIVAEDVESERRLMYVACTRARDSLILAVRPERKEENGKVYENPESRFVREIK